LVSSAWKTEDGTFMLQATVPPNTTAKIIIPANTDEDLLLNGSQFSENPGYRVIEKR
jgi:alpha-L-rhamnosidase